MDIFKASEAPIIFVQFNKPVYKSNDAFKFRVFVLTQKLVPYSSFGQMNIAIYGPNKNILWNDQKVTQISDYGVYEKSLNIQELQNLQNNFGIWTLLVEIDGRKISKSFEVQQQNSGDAEVFLHVPSEVAFEDRKIYLNIFTKNPRGKEATIFVTAKFVGSNKEEISKKVKSLKLTELKTTVMLDYEDDLGIRFPTKDMILKFIIQTSSTTVTKEVKMRHKGKHTIQVMRKKYFKPGFKFPTKIRVKLLDGKSDNSFNQLSTTVKYISKSKNGKTNVDEKTYQTNLKNGDAVFNLQPKAKTIKIQLLLKFAETEHTEEIEKFPGDDEYMQVSMVKKR